MGAETGIFATYGTVFTQDSIIEMASGSAFIFQKGTTWTDAQQKKIVPYDGDNRYLFGDSVSLYGDGDTALIGSHGNSLAYSRCIWKLQPSPKQLSRDSNLVRYNLDGGYTKLLVILNHNHHMPYSI